MSISDAATDIFPSDQTILAEETMLTVYNDGRQGNRTGQNMCIAFTVDDIDKEYQRVVSLGLFCGVILHP